jgi:alpha-glucosidase (family GH31 glycosyl hydrolase)
MRTHHGRSARENWSWESDAESIAHFRRWARLHIRLFPYLYAHADLAAQTGLPMFRSTSVEYPAWESGWSLVDEYMLGDRILVAPVVTEGATSREVLFPPDRFIALDGAREIDGGAAGTSATIDAPLEEIPVFVRAGTVLVLLPDGVDTLAGAAPAGGLVTLDDVGTDREIWLYGGGSHRFVEEDDTLVYDWDGEGVVGPMVAATWNGDPVTVAGGAVTIAGTGELAVDGAEGSGTLTIEGGAEARTLIVRLIR